MFTPGNILHGEFDLGTENKEKFAIVLYNDGVDCILTPLTTSQERSAVSNPCHGKNPAEGEAQSYVFKSKIEIEFTPDGKTPFFFHKDTTVVPDYGYTSSTIECFTKKVDNLKVVCKLYQNEYSDLIYTLYRCKYTPRKYKALFEGILSKIIK